MTLGDVVMVLGTITLTILLAVATVQTAVLLRVREIEHNPLLSPIDAGLRVGLIVVCLGLAAMSSQPASSFGLSGATFIADIAQGMGFGAVLAFVTMGVSTIAVRVWGAAIYSPKLVLALIPTRRREWVLVPLVLTVAVILEELLFRGLVIGGLGVWVHPVPLVIGFSVAFGLLHAPQGLLGIIVAFGASIVLGVLFLSTGSLIVPAVAHLVVNLVQLVVAANQAKRLRALPGSDSGLDDRLSS